MVLDDIDARFAALYGDASRGQRLALRQAMQRAQAARPDWLRARDAAARADPDWYLRQDRAGYCAYVDRFAGTLAGVRARIPYLRELGVTYLHLLPFWQRRAGENDGGFAVQDHARVDPAFGDNDDLRALTRALDAAGMTLCADFVLNHTADTHGWARAARAGDAEARACYHVFPDRTLPDRYERTLGQVFPETAPGNFTYVPDGGFYAWTTFYPYQWDLNWANPAVFVDMADLMLCLANQGVGALRLDSAAFLWKQLGTSCMGLPQAHDILRLLRRVAEAVAPSLLLKAEAVVPAPDLPAYFGLPDAPGGECHIAYQTSLMAAGWLGLAEGRADFPARVLSATAQPGRAGSWLTYVRCHDDIGWGVLRPESVALGDAGLTRMRAAAARLSGADPGDFPRGRAFQGNGLVATAGMAASLCGVEAALEDGRGLDAAIDRLALLHALAASAGGMPVLYMGDELGQLNVPDSQDADSRWLHRPYFDAVAAARALAGDGLAAHIFVTLRDILATRAKLADLAADRPVAVQHQEDARLLVLRRGDKFLGLFNFSGDTVAVPPAGATATTVLGMGAAGDPLPPWRVRWCLLRD